MELEIGRSLALARRERGLSLKEVEEATKIRAAYLGELERENFDVLPAVYVQGSLKTYANFLQLDGDALVRELKRRRAAVEEPRDPAPAEPQENDPFDRRAAVLGGAVGAGSPNLVEAREEPGSRPSPANVYGYLALGFAVFMVLALAVAVLVSTLAWEEEPAVSKVREPLIAQAPEASLVVEDEPSAPPSRQEDARGSDEEDDGPDDDGARFASPVARDGGDEGAAPATPTGQARAAGPSPDARGATARRPARTAPEPASAPTARDTGTVAPAERSPSPSPAPSAPVPQGGAVPEANAGGPGPITSSPRGGDFEVRIEVGGDDPVQITGHPTGAR